MAENIPLYTATFAEKFGDEVGLRDVSSRGMVRGTGKHDSLDTACEQAEDALRQNAAAMGATEVYGIHVHFARNNTQREGKMEVLMLGDAYTQRE